MNTSNLDHILSHFEFACIDNVLKISVYISLFFFSFEVEQRFLDSSLLWSEELKQVKKTFKSILSVSGFSQTNLLTHSRNSSHSNQLFFTFQRIPQQPRAMSGVYTHWSFLFSEAVNVGEMWFFCPWKCIDELLILLGVHPRANNPNQMHKDEG